METIVVNDTNIFIDLITINLLDEFFLLPIEIHTNVFVINELTDEVQNNRVNSFHPDKLYIKEYSGKEVAEIVRFQAICDNKVSFTDCSVWYYAHQNDYTLLTGDNKLRKTALTSGTKVGGILFVFDLLVAHCIITPEVACCKLEELSEYNKRLPSDEIKRKLILWRNA